MPVNKNKLHGDKDVEAIYQFLVDNKGEAFTRVEIFNEVDVSTRSMSGVYMHSSFKLYDVDKGYRDDDKYYYARLNPFYIFMVALAVVFVFIVVAGLGGVI